jgi:hypothetical protein
VLPIEFPDTADQDELSEHSRFPMENAAAARTQMQL